MKASNLKSYRLVGHAAHVLKSMRRIVVQLGYCMSCLALLTLTLTACGGGSSGTGESELLGQVIDRTCQPVASLNLSDVGIDSAETLSAEDGSFELAPTVSSSIQVPTNAGGREVDVSKPTCILLVYDRGTVVSVNSYPLGELPECSIDGVRGVAGLDTLPDCQEQG